MSDFAVETAHFIKTPFDPGDVVTTDRLDAYMDEGRPMLNNYTRHAKIGEGHHGEVYLCYQANPRLPPGHRDRRVAVAMKSVRRNNLRARQFKQLRQQRLPSSAHTPLVDRLGTAEAKIRKEIAIMKKCRHPHVVRLYEIIDDRTRDKIYMAMEYLAGGEVKWKNERDQPALSVDQTRRILRDAVLGLEYLHHQGIIHRDIKPANLLWTEDRRQVKIADFGVSHFSYALRLTAAGEEGSTENPEDPILLDDSDLIRRAGTPSFLAPEIVFEHTNSEPAESSATGSPKLSPNDSQLSIPAPPRPPITKAIDVWALGVTLYCLLFGRTPFVADPAAAGTEWSLYNAICNQDWTVEEVMGSNRISTGGRTPSPGDTSEGAQVMRLLDGLLKKDPSERMTLGKLKSSEWMLRDLPDPEQWLQLTRPRGKIDVSVNEASDAMSAVRFRWNWGVVSRRISSLFRRPRGPGERPSHDRDVKGSVRSDPHVSVRRHQSAYTATTTKSSSKGKRRAYESTTKTKLRSKSTEAWPNTTRNDTASHSTPAITEQVKGGGRRGSSTLFAGDHTPSVKPSTASSSPTASDKPRSRFTNLFNFNSISYRRSSKYLSLSTETSPTDTTPSAGPSTTDVVRRVTMAGSTSHKAATRRSDEVLRHYRSGGGTAGPSAPLMADRRASSWGQGDQPEVVSLTSSYDFLSDRNASAHGAGSGNVGVGSEVLWGERMAFLPRTPSRLSTKIATATASPTSAHPPSSPVSSERDKDVEDRFGPSCLDEDSSTIASAEGEWQDGHNLDLESEGGPQEGYEHAVFEDDDDDDDDSEDQVTFSPRKNTHHLRPLD